MDIIEREVKIKMVRLRILKNLKDSMEKQVKEDRGLFYIDRMGGLNRQIEALTYMIDFTIDDILAG